MLPTLLFASQRHSFNALSLRNVQAFSLPVSSQSPQVGTILILAAIELSTDIPIAINTIYEADIDILSLPVDQIAEQVSSSFRRLYMSLLSIQRQNVVKFIVRPTLRSLRLSTNGHVSSSQRTILHYICHGLDSQSTTGSILLYDEGADSAIRQKKIQLISIDDILRIVGDHALLVLDCNYAGSVINAIKKLDILDNDNVLVIAATSNTERLPLWLSSLNCYPADVFTQCLLNPVKMYVFSYIRKICMFASSSCTYEQCEAVYAYLQEPDKREFLNNINKVLKLLCEAIAWSSLPRDTFNMIYRQDKCVSTLYTGFILAQRILKDLRLTTQSLPPFPDTTTHRLWDVFDTVFNANLSSVYTSNAKLLNLGIMTFYFEQQTIKDAKRRSSDGRDSQTSSTLTIKSLEKYRAQMSAKISANDNLNLGTVADIKSGIRAPSKASSISSTANQSFIKKKLTEPTSSLMVSFLQDQLRTFELWLLNVHPSTEIPDSLPFVVVSIKIQQLRSKALDLITHFIDMSPWCLRATLELRLLQTVLHGVHTFQECESDQFRCILIICKIVVANYFTIPLIVNITKRRNGSGAAANKGNIEDVLCDLLVQSTASTDMRILCLIILTCLTTDQAVTEARLRHASMAVASLSTRDTPSAELRSKMPLHSGANSNTGTVCKASSATLTNGFGFYMPHNNQGNDPNTISECCSIIRENLIQRNMLEVLAVLVHSASEHIKLWSLLLLSELMYSLTTIVTDSKKLRSNRLSSPALHSYTKTIPTSNSMVIATSSSNLVNTSSRLFSLTFLPDQIEEIVEPLRSADELVSSAHDNFKQPDSVIAYGSNYGKIRDLYRILIKLLDPSMTAEIRAAAISVITSSLPVVDLISIIASHRVVDVFYPGDSSSEGWDENFSAGLDKGVNLNPPGIMINISKLCVYDVSPLVRHEALCCIARFITLYFQSFLSLVTNDLILAYDMSSNPYVKIFNGFQIHKVNSIIHTTYKALKQAMYDPMSTISIRARHIFDGLSSLALCLLLQTTPVTADFFHINCRSYLEKRIPDDSLTTKDKILDAVKQVFSDDTMQQIRLIMQKFSLLRDLSEKQIKHVLTEALCSSSIQNSQVKSPLIGKAETSKICVDSTGVVLKTAVSQGLSMSQFSKNPGTSPAVEPCPGGDTGSAETSENSFITTSIKQKNVPRSDSSSEQSDIAISDIDDALANVEVQPNDTPDITECDTDRLEFFKEKFLLLQKLDAVWLELTVRVCMPRIVASIYNCASVILTLSRNSVRFPSICFNIEAAAAVAAQEVHRSMRMCPVHSLLSINDRGASYYRMHNACCPCGRPALASLPLFLRDYFISPSSTKCLDFGPSVSLSLMSLDKVSELPESPRPSSGCSNSSRSEIISSTSVQHNHFTFNVSESIRSSSIDVEDQILKRARIFNSNEHVSSLTTVDQENKSSKNLWPSLFDLKSRKLSEFDHARLRSYFHFILIYLKNHNKNKDNSRQEMSVDQNIPRLREMVITETPPPGIPPTEYSALHASIYGVSFNACLPKICESYLYAVKTNSDDVRRLSPSTPIILTDGGLDVIHSKEQEHLNVLSSDKSNVFSLMSRRRKNASYLGNNITSLSNVQKLRDHNLLMHANSFYWDDKITKLFDCPINLLALLAHGTDSTNFATLQHRVDEFEHMHVIDHLCHFCRNAAVVNPLLTHCTNTMRTWDRNNIQLPTRSSIFHLTRDVNPLGTRIELEANKVDTSGKGLTSATTLKKNFKALKSKPLVSPSKAMSSNNVSTSHESVQSKLQTTASPFPYLEQMAYCEISQRYFDDKLMVPAEEIYSGYLIPYVCSLALHALFFEFSNYLVISLNDTEQSSILRYTQKNRASLFTTDNNSSIIWTKNNFLVEIHNRIVATINDIDYDRLSESLGKVRFLRLSDKQLGMQSMSLSQKSISSNVQPVPINSESSFQIMQKSSSNSQGTTQELKLNEATDSTIIKLTTESVPEGLFVMDMLPKVDSAHSIASETIPMINLRHLDTPSHATSRISIPDAESSNSCAFMTELDLLKQLHTMYPEQRNHLSIRFAPVKKAAEVREVLKKRTADSGVFHLFEYGSNTGARCLEKSTSLKKVKSISHCTGAIKNVVFHRNETILLTNNGCTCCIWNSMTGELLNKLPLDLILDIHPTSWPGGGLISGHIHTPTLALPHGSQSYSLINWAIDNCTAHESIILANMLEADAASLECPHCCLLNASRSPDYGVLKNFSSPLLKVLHKQGCASAKDFDSELLEKLFPDINDDNDATLIKSDTNAYSKMNGLIKQHRGPYPTQNGSNWLGDMVLLNQYTPHSVLAIAAADCTIRILTNYHDTSLCRHTAAFNVGIPSSKPLYSSIKLQQCPYAVAEFYRHKFNMDMSSPDTVLNHHKKQYIIARSKICNALFHEKKKPDEGGERTGERARSPLVSRSIPILRGHSDLLEMHTAAPHIITAIPGEAAIDYIDLMHESKYLTMKLTHLIDDVVPLSSNILNCGVLAYGSNEYSIFDSRSSNPIMSGKAPEAISGGALYDNTLFLSTVSGRLLSKNTTTDVVLKQYSIPNSRTVRFHNTGLFSCVEDTPSNISNIGSANVLTYNVAFGHVTGVGLGGISYKAPAQTEPQCIAFHPRVPLIAVPELSQISLWSL